MAWCAISALLLPFAGAAQAATAATVPAAPAVVLEADATLGQAIVAAETARAARLLDEEFEWIDRAGAGHTKADALRGLSQFRATATATARKSRGYGDVAVVTGTSRAQSGDSIQLLHVWIKRPDGWRAIVYQDNTIMPSAPPAPGAPPASGSAADCINPCKTVPYVPKNAAEREIVGGYNELETAVATHDAVVWAPHFADEFVVIGRDGHGTAKTGRIAGINRQKAANAFSNPGPLKSMRIWVVGDAAVMTAHHVTSGATATPYRVTRVWIKRDGRWQMAYSQQTTTEIAAATTLK